MNNKILKVKDTEIEILFSDVYKKNGEIKVLTIDTLELESIRLKLEKFFKSLNKKTKFISIFVDTKYKLDRNNVVSTTKVIIEGITKFVLENRELFLQRILIVLKEKKFYNIFSKVAFDHIGYINRKIGLYPIPTVDIIIEVNTKYKKGVFLVER